MKVEFQKVLEAIRGYDDTRYSMLKEVILGLARQDKENKVDVDDVVFYIELMGWKNLMNFAVFLENKK